MKKIGILGGTFNPLHNGHMYMAYESKEVLGLDEIILMPNFIPPHKDANERDPSDALEMLERVFSARKGFKISTYELDKKGYSYTYETLAYFTKNFPDDEFYFIIGEDSYVNFSTWKNPKTILEMVTLVVLHRHIQDRENESATDQLINSVGGRVVFVPSKILEISSEDLRERVFSKREIGHFVPKEVERYIYERKLYCQETME